MDAQVRPTARQQLFIRAVLHSLIDLDEFDRLFSEFSCSEISKGVALIFVTNEFVATEVEAQYTSQLLLAIMRVMKFPVQGLDIRPIYSLLTQGRNDNPSLR